MVTLRAAIITMMLVSILFFSPLTGLTQAPTLPDTDQNGIASEERDANPTEMRANIVGKDRDEFIAKTEDGEEFRLPMEGAPSGVDVGDELRLVPDPSDQTIYVFKAEPSDNGTPDAEL